jgi:CRP-like cAMP-binding protein
MLLRESDRVKSLREVALFDGLGKSDLEQIAKISHSVERTAGDVLMRQGEPGTELMILVEGTAKAETDGTVVEELGANRVLGELALIDSEPRSATVTAVTECSLLVVPYFAFWEFMERAPTVQRQLLITLAKRIRRLNRQIASES